ncbi:hypothetical protein LTR85_002005 [Meristemomyces frigidus]|nr:hypothetical protein LTR85_002005 [Meristemomyces frigidus]
MKRLSKRGLLDDIQFRLLPWYFKCYDFVRLSEETNTGFEASFRTHFMHEARSTDGFQMLLHQGDPVQGKVHFSGGVRDLFDRVSRERASGPDRFITAAQMYADLETSLHFEPTSYWFDLTRVLARTSDHHVGWIPERSRVGDRICLFAGAPFPFVIRDIGEGYYELIGDAYIQGIMNGEAWPEDEAEIETISLK